MMKKSELGKSKGTSRHFVFIETPVDLVWPEIVLWSESSWWPKTSIIQYKKKSAEEGQKPGTGYIGRLRKPLFPKWEIEITLLEPRREVRRTAIQGMLKGEEDIKLETRYNGTRVDYSLHYEIRGFWNKIFWRFFYYHWYDRSIDLILTSLQGYVLNQYQGHQEKQWEDDHPQG